jgi:hypothetical protein
MANRNSTVATTDESSLVVPRVYDLHGRQRDPFTGNAMEDGQEGPNSIFYVPGLPSETSPDYVLYMGDGKPTPFSKHMRMLRDAGFEGSSMFMHVTPRPQDRSRIPSPPPDLSDSLKARVVATFYRTNCNYCWAIIRGKERESGFRLEEIKGAADRGCGTCDVLLNSIERFANMIFPSFDRSKVRVRQKFEARSQLLSDTKEVRVCFDEYHGETLVLSFSDESKQKCVFEYNVTFGSLA